MKHESVDLPCLPQFPNLRGVRRGNGRLGIFVLTLGRFALIPGFRRNGRFSFTYIT